MNCINHPETPVSAYCQNCGKALCQECVRSIGGVVYCEACLAARLNNPAAAGKGTGSVYVGLPASGFPNPGLALGLGFIPGVGAMYNGQFVKGLVHVFVFALLCSFSSHESFFGILIPFWIFYQVFDAYQTAKARRDGTPLPNPFGLNDLGYRLGLQQHPEGTQVPPVVPPAAPYTPPAAGAPYTPPAADWTSYVPPQPPAAEYFAPGFVPGSTPPYTPPYTPGAAPYVPMTPPVGQNQVPTGAIVLIALGALFLLGSLGIFHDDWIGRSWPLVIVGVGVWLLIRRTRETRLNPPVGPAAPGPSERNSL
jgi:hypothetical protein